MSKKSSRQTNIEGIRPFLITSHLSRMVAIGLLLLLWGRLLQAANHQAATYDESIHLLHGVLFWQAKPLFSVVQNPPLVNALMGLPVHLMFHPNLPPHDPLLPLQDWFKISQQFMWQVNSNGLQLLWVGRWVIMLLTLLLGALAFRFAGQLYRRNGAGLLALLLLSFDPNILAHGSLATTDLGMAFFLLLAVYFIWRYWQPQGQRPFPLFFAAAVALGLAFSAKFTAVILIPALLLLILYRAVSQRHGWRVFLNELLPVTGWIIIGIAMFLILYRFQWPALQTDYRLQQEHQLTGHSAFFHGQLSLEGWWYYFPLAFLIKTPIATLLLILWSVFLAVRPRPWPSWSSFWLLLPVGAIVGSGFVSHVNIGYRYLLPMLPLLFVLSGNIYMVLTAKGEKVAATVRRVGLGIALLGLIVSSLVAQPDYLAYFNVLIGGPKNGWQWLADSNLDWGQELIALAEYEKDHFSEPYQVSWLGSAPLAAYGIQYGRPMPIWPQGREDPMTDPFYPAAPAPGTYVLSATQLHGVYLQNTARFAWFQAQPPTDRIGYSLFVYDVPPTGPAVGLGLSGIGPAMIAPDDYLSTFQSNDVRPRWFDARTSLLWPGGGSDRVWTAVGTSHLPTDPLLTSLYPGAGPVLEGSQRLDEQMWRYVLYEWVDSPVAQILNNEAASTDFGWSAEPVVGVAEWAEQRLDFGDTAVFDETFTLLGYQISSSSDAVAMLSLWRVQQPPAAELKIFVHLLDATGQVVAQHDGLDVGQQALQPGDEFAQLHTIPLPPDLPSGTYALQIGLYRVAEGSRLPLAVDGRLADRLLLQLVEIVR